MLECCDHPNLKLMPRADDVAQAKRMLMKAAVLQGIGAIPATFIFAMFAEAGYRELTHSGFLHEALLAPLWLPAPLALGLAVPLSMGNRMACDACRFLTFTYPVIPLVNFAFYMSLGESFHGGEFLFVLLPLPGLAFSIPIWRLITRALGLIDAADDI